MTLYTYVPGKAELLDLMLDTVYAACPAPTPPAQPWRDRAAAVAGENRALFARTRGRRRSPPPDPRSDRARWPSTSTSCGPSTGSA